MQTEHIEHFAACRMLDPSFKGEDLIRQILSYAAQSYSILKNGHDMSLMEEMVWIDETLRLHKEKNAEQYIHICEAAQVYLDNFWRPNFNLGKMRRTIDFTKAKSGAGDDSDEGCIIWFLMATIAQPIDFGREENNLRCKAVADWFLGGDKPLFTPEVLLSEVPEDRKKIRNRFKSRKKK